MRHYDIIFLGDSLAARIAAAMLGKAGLRVLTLTEGGAPSSPWFFSSLHLEKLLENLGGRSCLAPPPVFQVVTAKTRLEFHGALSLEEEFRREFPAAAPSPEALLGRLQTIGQRLEEALWACGGLPLLGAGSRLRFATRRLFKGLFAGRLRSPLAELLAPLDEEPKKALAALFTALARKPFRLVTLAEGALLWSSAGRSGGVSRPGLEELLRRRYEQFNGATEELSKVAEIRRDGPHLTGITTRDGGKCNADCFVLGSLALSGRLPGELSARLQSPPPAPAFRINFAPESVSPIFAPGIILAGNPLLRLGFLDPTERSSAIGEAVSGSDTPINADQVEAVLAPFFPFASPRIEKIPPAGTLLGKSPRRLPFPGAANPLRLGRDTYLCDGAAILPSLGSTGEVLVGMSLAREIIGRRKGSK